MSGPLISIILPTRNRLGTIRDTISQIQAQTVAEWELIISDNASDEPGKAAYLDELAASDPRVKVHHQRENIGIHGNWIFCIQQCRGRYYIASTDDDRWGEKAYLELLLAMHDGRVAVVFPNLSIEHLAGGRFQERILTGVYHNGMSRAEVCLQMVTHRQGVLMMGLFNLDLVTKDDLCRVYDHRRNGHCETVGMVRIAREHTVRFQEAATYIHSFYDGNYVRGCDREEVLRDSALSNFILLEDLRLEALNDPSFALAAAMQWKNCVNDARAISRSCRVADGRVVFTTPPAKSALRLFFSRQRKAFKQWLRGSGRKKNSRQA